MDLAEFFKAIRRYWVVVFVLTLIGVATGLSITVATTPKYQSEAELYVSVTPASDSTDTNTLIQGANFSKSAVTSYVSIAHSAVVLDKVIEDLDLNRAVDDLRKQITVTSPSDTALIDVTVIDTDSGQAADIANSVGDNLAKVVTTELESTDGDEGTGIKISTINPAVAGSAPVTPNLLINLLVGGVVGFIVSLSAALLWSVLDTRIRNSTDVTKVTNAPLLGSIPFDASLAKQQIVAALNPLGPIAEAFRVLRTNLRFVDATRQSKAFTISSATPNDGKTTTAVNLAIALSETGAKVVIVDGDLRRPKVASYMGVEGGVGLSDVLANRTGVISVLQRWGRYQLYVLPAGRIPPNPAELLASWVMADLVKSLQSEFDYVLIDTTPLLAVADAAAVSTYTSGTILVVAAKATRMQDIRGSMQALKNVHAPLLGTVLTKLPSRGPDSPAYGYGTYSSMEHLNQADVGLGIFDR